MSLLAAPGVGPPKYKQICKEKNDFLIPLNVYVHEVREYGERSDELRRRFKWVLVTQGRYFRTQRR